MKVLITGSRGFIAGYLIELLLEQGWDVVGVDNNSKYGEYARTFESHPRFKFIHGDAKNTELLTQLLDGCDHFVAAAAIIGGIALFHKYPYTLLAENERIIAAECDAALQVFGRGRLKKITLVSSSMVYENSMRFPTCEGDQLTSPSPSSSYGFQKLVSEYYVRAAYEQYGLPYTIVRPFNCIGIGEFRSVREKSVVSGEISMVMSHVVPDLIQKILRGQDPLHILGDGSQVRHYTYGRDIALGLSQALVADAAALEDFNLSSATPMTVLELAKMIWTKIKPEVPFRYSSDPPYAHDVQHRVPDVGKAERILGFTATTPVATVLDEVIPWVRREVERGRI